MALRNLISKLRSSHRPEQLRAIGTLILILGVVAGVVFYVVQSRRAEPSLDELLPGYTRAMHHEIGVQMGSLGLILMDLQQMLSRPGPEGVLIAAGFALLAACFFRAAWVLDYDAAERRRAADATRQAD